MLIRINKVISPDIISDSRKWLLNSSELKESDFSNYITRIRRTDELSYEDANYKFSFLVCVYNTPDKLLAKCIESLLNSNDNIQIIVVNDGGEDKYSLLKNYEDYPADIFYISYPANLGLGYARNIGLEYVKGELFTIMDSDDYFTGDLNEIISNQGNYDAVVYKGINESPEGDVIDKSFDWRIDADNHFIPWQHRVVFKKSIAAKFKMPEMKFYEDAAGIVLRSLTDNVKFEYNEDKCFYHYVQNQGSILHSNYNDRKWMMAFSSISALLECYELGVKLPSTLVDKYIYLAAKGFPSIYLDQFSMIIAKITDNDPEKVKSDLIIRRLNYNRKNNIQDEFSDKFSISFIINNFITDKNKDEFYRALDSVRNIAQAGDEIIVVEDSGKPIGDYYQGDDYKLIINEENSSLYISRKKGVGASKNNFIMFLDSDDYYLNPDLFNEKVRSNLSTSRIITFEQDTNYFTTKGSHNIDDRVILAYLTSVSRASVAMKVIDKKSLEMVYDYLGDHYINQQEDYLLINALLLSGSITDILDSGWVGYHYSPTNMSSKRIRTEEEINSITDQSKFILQKLKGLTNNKLYHDCISNRINNWISKL